MPTSPRRDALWSPRAVVRRTAVRLAVAAAGASGVLVASAASAPTTSLLSVSTDGVSSAGLSYFPSITSNGRFVAWDSQAEGLVANDENGLRYDSFVRDLATGTTGAASLRADGTTTSDGDSFETSVTPSGRFVAFGSDGTDLLSGRTKTASKEDIYLRDRKLGANLLVSVNAAGSDWCSGSCESTSISDNGRWVAFASNATDLVATPTDGSLNVYVRDVKAGVTTLVSANAAGTAGGNGQSNQPTISGNGRYVVFTSTAPDLVPGGTSGRGVFLRDLRTGQTTVVSDDVTIFAPNPATISANGRYVAWLSADRDAYVKDLRTSVTRLASPLADGKPSQSAFAPRLSGNGRYVVYSSNHPGVLPVSAGPKAAGVYDIYLHDLAANATIRLSVDATGGAGGNGHSSYPSISKNGRLVVFQSDATNLTAGAVTATPNIFLRGVR